MPKRHEDFIRDKYSTMRNVLRSQASLASATFSPIYDSGCCLGRELLDDRVMKMLTDTVMKNSYITKGKSTIRFSEGKAPRHFDLIMQLSKRYPAIAQGIIKRIEDLHSPTNVESIVNLIDRNLPDFLLSFALPDHRKELMVKLINSRVSRLIGSNE